MSWQQPSQSDKSVASWGVDVAVSLFFAGVGIAAIVDSRRLGAGWGADGPESGAFPFIIGLALVVASLVNLVSAVRTRDNGETFVTWGQFRLVLAMMVPAALYVGAIPFLGIYLASAILGTAFLRFLGNYGWLASLVFGIGVSVLAFFVFDVWFLVPLPKGPIEHALGY
jgi:hypothetical protein